MLHVLTFALCYGRAAAKALDAAVLKTRGSLLVDWPLDGRSGRRPSVITGAALRQWLTRHLHRHYHDRCSKSATKATRRAMLRRASVGLLCASASAVERRGLCTKSSEQQRPMATNNHIEAR